MARSSTVRQDHHSPAPIRVLFALLPDSLVLDWAGPAEALRIANQCLQARGEPERFTLEFAGPAAVMRSSVGVQLCGLKALAPELSGLPSSSPAAQTAAGVHQQVWVVLVGQPGGAMDVGSPEALTLLHWLRGLRLRSGHLELITICAGALLAAHAGLLAGRRATTHHQHLETLAAVEPRCDVVANRIYVVDGPMHSSAGVTTGIDLMLQRIAHSCDPSVAAQVAQTLVMSMRRGTEDPQTSPFLEHRSHLHPGIHRVQDAVTAAPEDDWHLSAMAAVAHVSPRHLTRLFVEHACIAPLAWLRSIRLARAEALLHAGRNVTQAAELAGFASDTQLRRAWHQAGRPGSPGSPNKRSSPQAI